MNQSPKEIPTVQIYISIVKRYGRAAFGIRIHWFDEVIFAAGWFGDQKVNAQMVALDCCLSAIELSGERVAPEVIFRTPYISHRLGMARDRKVSEQHGISMRPMIEDKDRWQDVAFRADVAGVKIGRALEDYETTELGLIDRKLNDLFFEDREFRFRPTPLEPLIELPTVPGRS